MRLKILIFAAIGFLMIAADADARGRRIFRFRNFRSPRVRTFERFESFNGGCAPAVRSFRRVERFSGGYAPSVREFRRVESFNGGYAPSVREFRRVESFNSGGYYAPQVRSFERIETFNGGRFRSGFRSSRLRRGGILPNTLFFNMQRGFFGPSTTLLLRR